MFVERTPNHVVFVYFCSCGTAKAVSFLLFFFFFFFSGYLVEGGHLSFRRRLVVLPLMPLGKVSTWPAAEVALSDLTGVEREATSRAVPLSLLQARATTAEFPFKETHLWNVPHLSRAAFLSLVCLKLRDCVTVLYTLAVYTYRA